jgi:Rha family phage regulatory protein
MINLVSPAVQLIDSKLMVSSLNIAEVFKKRHDNVLRKIEVEINKGQLTALNFEGSDYIDKTNVKRLMYLLDERFATKLIMSFTGINADKYVLAYIDEFIRMRETLNNNVRFLELEEENRMLKEKNRTLKEKVVSLEIVNKLNSEKATLLQLESAEEARKRQERYHKNSPFYELSKSCNLFGEVEDKYRFVPPEKEHPYKTGKCETGVAAIATKGLLHKYRSAEHGVIMNTPFLDYMATYNNGELLKLVEKEKKKKKVKK